MDQDEEEKDGQIAHLDRDPDNNDPDNLAYLCFRHHYQYDTRASQGKGLTEDEVRAYRQRLVLRMEATEPAEARRGKILQFPLRRHAASVGTLVGDGNIVAGGDVKINVSTPRIKAAVIPGTVAQDARMIGYLEYLVGRYNELKDWECKTTGQKMKWALIRVRYKRELKYDVKRTPIALFEDAARFLQTCIENSKLGRMERAKGKTLYSPFETFDARGKPRA